jgi:hypothetical protein
MARFCKCPNCGALHAIERTASDRDEVRLAPCRTCRVNGELSRLAWEAPRRNRYRRH